MRAYLRLKTPLLKELEDSLPPREKKDNWADHIGVDEAGRGCLAGPVVAAATLFPANMNFEKWLPGLTDSKKLTEKQREALVEPILAKSVAWGIGIIWQDEIDRINILAATHRAMSHAVLALCSQQEEKYGANFTLPRLCVDGNSPIPAKHWQACCQGISPGALAWEQYLPSLQSRLPARAHDLPEQETIVDGDAIVPSISAASVLAKTKRDEIMRCLEHFFPGYGLAQHKGYGTKEHRDILEIKGPSLLHRRSFRLAKNDTVSEQLSLPSK